MNWSKALSQEEDFTHSLWTLLEAFDVVAHIYFETYWSTLVFFGSDDVGYKGYDVNLLLFAEIAYTWFTPLLKIGYDTDGFWGTWMLITVLDSIRLIAESIYFISIWDKYRFTCLWPKIMYGVLALVISTGAFFIGYRNTLAFILPPILLFS